MCDVKLQTTFVVSAAYTQYQTRTYPLLFAFSFFFFANTPSPSGTFFTKQHTSACRKPTLFLCVYVRVCKRVNVCMRAEARLVLVLVQHLNPNSFWLQESQRSDPHSHTHTYTPVLRGDGVRGLGRHLLSMHVWIFY